MGHEDIIISAALFQHSGQHCVILILSSKPHHAIFVFYLASYKYLLFLDTYLKHMATVQSSTFYTLKNCWD